MDTIRGQVAVVRIIREGWGLLEVLHGSANERTTVTGHPLGVEMGDTVEIDGSWAHHPRFGRQFKAREIRVVTPSDAAGAIEWMRSRLPNVGRKLATEICERWGVDGAWHVLEREPWKLAELRGITPTRATSIHEAYVAHLGERDRMVALKGWGLTDRQIAKVVETWGERAIEEMRADPYQLAELVDGFGFRRSDAVALRMGLPHDHPSRIRAALVHLLGEAAGQGHAYVPGAKLVSMASRMLEVPCDVVRREAYALIDGGRAVRRGGAVYRPALAVAEEGVAASVRRLVGGDAAARKGEAA